MTKSESRKLRAKLPTAYSTIIKERLKGQNEGGDFSEAYITQVACAYRQNITILNALLELATETAGNLKSIRESIKNL